MTTKFHVTDDGVRPCKATVKACPLGGENIHFTSQQDAQAAYEAKMAEEHGVVASQKKATGIDLDAMDRYDRWELARETDDPALLARLAEDEDEDVQGEVAANKSTPVEVLEILAKSEDEDLQAAVARHPNVTTEVLDRMADNCGDERYEMQLAVAQNPKTSGDRLGDLAWGPFGDVREAALRHRSFPPDILFSMQFDEDWGFEQDDVEDRIIQNLTGAGQWEKKENMQELFDAARQDGMAFRTEAAFREAYDYTYGEGAMGNPMLAANIFAEPREN